jgi:hypothetical protein
VIAKLDPFGQQANVGFLRQLCGIIGIACKTEPKPVKVLVVQGHDLVVIQFVHLGKMRGAEILFH